MLGLLFSGTLAPAVAQASPGVDGTRNLAMGDRTRASASGTNAALTNPAHMSFSQQFAIEPLYQLKLQNRTSGVGILVMDSLNNPRFALGLGYLFMRGTPQVEFTNSAGEEDTLELVHYGHEVLGAISVVVVKQWLAIGIKPKYQYTSLRYRDDQGVAHNAHDKLNAFGLDTAVSLNLAGWVQLAVVGYNLLGSHDPAFVSDSDKDLAQMDVDVDTFDRGTVSRLSDYPLMLGHGLAVFPLNHPDLSLNFDGTYDFTSFRNNDKHTRLTYGGSIEWVIAGVPLRFGSYWDSRDRGKDDDRVFVAGGIGYIKPAKLGGIGVDLGFGFSQQVAGPRPETILGLNIGLRIHPDL